jgi:hypothetical protein
MNFNDFVFKDIYSKGGSLMELLRMENQKEKSVIEPPRSACCDASIDLDTLFCGRCGDHSGWVEVEYEPEWTEAEQANQWGE